jgi:hypothetical protein
MYGRGWTGREHEPCGLLELLGLRMDQRVVGDGADDGLLLVEPVERAVLDRHLPELQILGRPERPVAVRLLRLHEPALQPHHERVALTPAPTAPPARRAARWRREGLGRRGEDDPAGDLGEEALLADGLALRGGGFGAT